ncbi:MAG: GntR family transcriptional regulator [Arachnia sp.]
MTFSWVTPIQQASLGDQVADALRRAIISQEVAPGSRLIELNLADKYGVSRGPIREAFAKLQAEGLIQAGRRGAFVIGITDRDIAELYSLRETIELMATRLLVARRDEVDWRSFEECLSAMRKAAERSDHAEFSRCDIAFHATLYAQAGHRRLLDVWKSYERTFEVVLEQSGRQGLELMAGAEDHEHLLQTFRESSVEECCAAVELHVQNAHERLIGRFVQVG